MSNCKQGSVRPERRMWTLGKDARKRYWGKGEIEVISSGIDPGEGDLPLGHWEEERW